MAKKFKLVYEDAGQLKGSYTGVPTEDDIALIDKAVLDGEEEPKPIEPTGTIEINENGTIDVADYATAEVNVAIPEEYIIPEGTKEIRANGEYNIREFENVNIDIPGATTKELFEATENGTYDIAEYANVKVDVAIPEGYIIPEGSMNIEANGDYNVTSKAEVNVNVPVGVFPSGSLDITENANNIDVTNKASVNVNVPVGVFPDGTLDITENENAVDVTDYAYVNVDVQIPEGYIIPEGTLEITENAEQIDVADYEYVDVNVEPIDALDNGAYLVNKNEGTITELYKTSVGEEEDELYTVWGDLYSESDTPIYVQPSTEFSAGTYLYCEYDTKIVSNKGIMSTDPLPPISGEGNLYVYYYDTDASERAGQDFSLGVDETGYIYDSNSEPIYEIKRLK